MENKLSKIKLGILGGGQLARMMALKCHNLGIKPYILSPHKEDPAAMVTAFYECGSLQSKKDLKKFLSLIDVATFENEFLNIATLQKAAFATKTPIHPKPQIMHLLQDKLTQKKLLKEHKIPTAYFISHPDKRQVNDFPRLFPKGVVIKKRQLGYDGGGIKIVKDINSNKESKQFILKHADHVIVEEFVPFKKELALILVRNRKKQIVELPLVETYQENSCCVWVKGPCQQKNKSKLVSKLKTFLNKINYEGVMAFELFETTNGDLMVNELAPRVHNSGHYSLDALSEDQFSLHIKAVLNLNITQPVIRSGGFAMLNLLGGKGQLSWKSPARALQKTPAHLHWYGKTLAKEGRKMGHINVLESTVQKALSKILQIKKDYLL